MNFVVFSDDWGVHPSSCQHIFSVLAPDHPTVWVNSIGMRPPRLTLEDAGKAVRKLRNMFTAPGPRPETSAGGPLVVAPPMLPFHGPRALTEWNTRSVVDSVTRAAARLGVSEYVAVTTVPNVHAALARLPARRSVYYCVDDFSEWPGMDRERLVTMEERLIDEADAAICTSQALLDKLTGRLPCRLLTHGVDVEHFAAPGITVHPCLAAVPEPRLGYCGLLDARTDFDLLGAVAGALPRVSFVFVGPVESVPPAFTARENVHLAGAVPYADLPRVLAGLAVCALPYRLTPLTEKINPLKLKEYLAAGKPVLSTPLPEAVRLAPFVRIADGPAAWVQALRELLDAGTASPPAGLDTFLAGESWAGKAGQFLDMCENPGRPGA